MRVSEIFLYDEPAVPEIRIEKLAEFLEETFGARVRVMASMLDGMTEETARELAAARVFRPGMPFERHEPAAEEVEMERRTPRGIIYYDGYEMQRIFSGLVPEAGARAGIFHIAFTSRLACTYDEGDGRYHGRALIGANPSIISTTGMVEAPAKPRQYYVWLLSNMARGLNMEQVSERYAGASLAYHDERTAEVAKGYLLQALFYYITGDAFCESPECRLYNAHWQRDLLYSQIESGRLCKRHQDALGRYRAGQNPARRTGVMT